MHKFLENLELAKVATKEGQALVLRRVSVSLVHSQPTFQTHADCGHDDERAVLIGRDLQGSQSQVLRLFSLFSARRRLIIAVLSIISGTVAREWTNKPFLRSGGSEGEAPTV
jgi:hypothetical protein